MGIIESLFYVIGFFVIFMLVAGVFFIIDLGLNSVFGKGIFPKDFWL